MTGIDDTCHGAVPHKSIGKNWEFSLENELWDDWNQPQCGMNHAEEPEAEYEPTPTIACMDQICTQSEGTCHGAMPDYEPTPGVLKEDIGVSRQQPPHRIEEGSVPPRGGSKTERLEAKGKSKKQVKESHNETKGPEPSFNIIFHNVNSFTDVVKSY